MPSETDLSASLDFRANPALIERDGLTLPTIGEEAYEYLEKSHALGDTPVKRLRQMNEKAYRLYLDHGIDLEREPLEIHVAAQHLNGGLTCDAWYESPTLRGLYPVGECGGVFGIRRPGGSALNSTQVGSTRAAEKIAQEGRPAPALSDALARQLIDAAKIASLLSPDGADTAEILEARRREGLRHDACAAFLRSPEKVKDLLRDTARQIDRFTDEERAKDFRALVELLIHRDTLVTRMATTRISQTAGNRADRSSSMARTGSIRRTPPRCSRRGSAWKTDISRRRTHSSPCARSPGRTTGSRRSTTPSTPENGSPPRRRTHRNNNAPRGGATEQSI